MLTIDVHAHIGSFAGYDLSEATLLAEVAEAGVALALVSNIDGPAVPGKTRDLPEAEANAATHRFVRSYPGHFRGLLRGRPDRGDASAPRLLALARRHPTVPVVLCHTGFRGPHEPAIAAAETALADGSANVWIETAQLPPGVALEAVERVGAGRVFFGTDATFFERGHYARDRPLHEALARALGEEDRARILHRNALAPFRLDDADASPAS